jgi:hypothetical protein
MKINEEQIGLAFGGSYDVVIPHLLAQCLAHDDRSLLSPVPR